MSESIFEHVVGVPQRKLKRLSQPQIERLLTPKHMKVPTTGLLFGLDLGVYRLPAGDLVIGFGEDAEVHDHDRWWFYSASPASRWQMVEADAGRQSLSLLPGMASYLTETAEVRGQVDSGDFMVLQSLAVTTTMVLKEFERAGVDGLAQRDVLLAGRNPGALDEKFLRRRHELTYRDVHDLVYHADVFKRQHALDPALSDVYVRALFGLGEPALAAVD